jgi:NAD(P)-dependent dehydrogenase (short-subunit alcohol dehydrogenase family)
VNAVSPGWFPTRMNGFLEDGAQRAWIDAHTSLRRPGFVAEIVGPVLFLAGDDASYVTGQTLRVDGG